MTNVPSYAIKTYSFLLVIRFLSRLSLWIFESRMFLSYNMELSRSVISIVD